MDYVKQLLDIDASLFGSAWLRLKPQLRMPDALDAEKVLHALTFPLPPQKEVAAQFKLLWNPEAPHLALGFFRRTYRADFARPEVRQLMNRCLERSRLSRLNVGRIDPFGNLNEFEAQFCCRIQRDWSQGECNTTLAAAEAMLVEIEETPATFDAEMALIFACELDLLLNHVEGVKLFESQRGMKLLNEEVQALMARVEELPWEQFFNMKFPPEHLRAVVAEMAVPRTPDEKLYKWQRVFFDRKEYTPGEIEALLAADFSDGDPGEIKTRVIERKVSVVTLRVVKEEEEKSDPATFLPLADGTYEEEK